MKDSGSVKQAQDAQGGVLSKGKAGRPRPAIEVPAPLAPGTAQVLIKVSKILTASAPGGPACAQGNCQAEARVKAVMGYGAGFQDAFGEGQIIKVYFPAGMKLVEKGERQIEVQDLLEVNLMAPTPANGWFTVNSFSRRK
ncbi:hypothetical protein TH63_15865 [Rufibacter radiotolerans]|uniref:Uncharacterized protein n=1 Tax=Rufibacter radiotolerans TaxID=1379910 RepID=A0A0H4VSM1_9BACT|nr:hypothetical protein [Rufibacter radiotolerans]AKQ46764.1 hypothetical protein TH63_15865 [Rufibacter radiotolerans]